MLRDSLRGFLGEQWRADSKQATPEEVSAIWTKLVGQGVASLGRDFAEGGLREILVVMAELGRAACPAPMWSAALANLALSGLQADAAVDLLEKLHAGTARVAFSFGALDPDRHAGSVRLENGQASGLLRFVEVADSCTHLLVAVDKSALVVVELGAAGVDLEPTRALGAWGLHEVRLVSAPATLVAPERFVSDDLLIEGKLALMARAYGAARRAFELAVDYAKERKQFGQAIGKFQAIQHKLADGLIALEGVRLTLDHAAICTTARTATGDILPIRLLPSPVTALRRVSLETQHAFGAIGYAEEHEAPRHFKRVHLDTLALGGAPHARRRTRRVSARRRRLAGCRNTISARPAMRSARRCGRGWSTLDRRAQGRRSTRSPSHDREFDLNSRATSARPAGSASAGRTSSAARRARRSSRSPSSR